jgi:hypothetical protein
MAGTTSFAAAARLQHSFIDQDGKKYRDQSRLIQLGEGYADCSRSELSVFYINVCSAKGSEICNVTTAEEVSKTGQDFVLIAESL